LLGIILPGLFDFSKKGTGESEPKSDEGPRYNIVDRPIKIAAHQCANEHEASDENAPPIPFYHGLPQSAH